LLQRLAIRYSHIPSVHVLGALLPLLRQVKNRKKNNVFLPFRDWNPPSDLATMAKERSE
jgi:hypothetical protein